jgi:DNA-binding transcriptional regulator PaaX
MALDESTQRVLGMFAQLSKDVLDLHQLFEAGGNEPAARTAVFDTVERLVKEGLLEERGNDFYSLTDKGREAARLPSSTRP